MHLCEIVFFLMRCYRFNGLIEGDDVGDMAKALKT